MTISQIIKEAVKAFVKPFLALMDFLFVTHFYLLTTVFLVMSAVISVTLGEFDVVGYIAMSLFLLHALHGTEKNLERAQKELNHREAYLRPMARLIEGFRKIIIAFGVGLPVISVAIDSDGDKETKEIAHQVLAKLQEVIARSVPTDEGQQVLAEVQRIMQLDAAMKIEAN